MSIDFMCHTTILLLVTPIAVEVLVWMRDLGCGHPILIRVCQRGDINLAVMNKPESSASSDENMTNLIIWATVRTGPSIRETAQFFKRKMYAHAQLRTLVSLRYEASE